MNEILGQITGFSFRDVSDGVNDPQFGNDLERIFVRDWQAQVRTADRGILGPLKFLFGGIEGATVQAKNIDGNEHIRASWEGPSDLPSIDQDYPGFIFVFAFSLKTILFSLDSAWSLLVGSPGPDYGRVGIAPGKQGFHDPTSPLELTDLAILRGSLNIGGGQTKPQWVTVIKGTYHTPDALPNATFTLTNVETLGVDLWYDNAIGQFGQYRSTFTYDVSQKLEVDTGSLEKALQALAFFGAAAFGSLGIPLGASVNSVIQQRIQGAISTITTPLLTVLTYS